MNEPIVYQRSDTLRARIFNALTAAFKEDGKFVLFSKRQRLADVVMALLDAPLPAGACIDPTEYTVSLLPEDNVNHGAYALTVAYRGRGKWAVTHMRQCLGADGEWDYESIPSERTDEWLATHRFDLATALALAAEHAQRVKVNGRSVSDVLASICHDR